LRGERVRVLQINLAVAMVVIVMASGLPVKADDTGASTVRSLGSFDCIPIAMKENFSATSEGIRVGSLSINEQPLRSENSAALSVSYAVENRSSLPLLVNIDFLLVDAADHPLAALTAGPPNMRIAALRSEIGRDWTPVKPGTMATASSICTRVFYRAYEGASNAP